jgi:hypothetical protein
MPWSKPLANDLPLKDGRTLHTLHDAATCSLPVHGMMQ